MDGWVTVSHSWSPLLTSTSSAKTGKTAILGRSRSRCAWRHFCVVFTRRWIDVELLLSGCQAFGTGLVPVRVTLPAPGRPGHITSCVSAWRVGGGAPPRVLRPSQFWRWRRPRGQLRFFCTRCGDYRPRLGLAFRVRWGVGYLHEWGTHRWGLFGRQNPPPALGAASVHSGIAGAAALSGPSARARSFLRMLPDLPPWAPRSGVLREGGLHRACHGQNARAVAAAAG